jgi:hypothetical protein
MGSVVLADRAGVETDGVVVVEFPMGRSAAVGRWAGVAVGANGVVVVFMIVC